jgi:hypothetical protein
LDAQSLKNRIVAHRRVRAADLRPHPRNPRTHSPAQRAALNAILAEVGLARSVLAYVADADKPLGTAAPLTLIDGHLRKQELREADVEVEVLDVSDAEADKLLLTLDPLTQLADYDEEVLDRLRESVRTESDDLAALWDSLAAEDAAALDELRRQGGPEKRRTADDVPEEFFVLVRCADEKQQVALLKRFRKEGLQCEAKMS